MKRFILSLLALSLTTSLWSCKEIVIAGINSSSEARLEVMPHSRVRTLNVTSEVTKIDARQDIEVRYIPTGQKSITVTSNLKDPSLLNIHVSGNTLIAAYKKGARYIGGSVHTVVEISGYTINEMKSSSSGEIKVLQPLTLQCPLNISTSSSGSISLIGGTATAVNIAASSSGDVDLNNFNTPSLTIAASSGADVDCEYLTADNVNISASSGADVDCKGTARTANFTASSGADISADKLFTERAVATASSGADIDCKARSLQRNTSSGGSVTNH